MGFSLYRVAALSPQGEHTLLPAYEDSGIVLGNLRDAADWRQAAGLLDQWVEQQSISPEKQLTTAADGKAALEGLPTGLYLLCAAPYQKGGCTYTTTSVLLELPLKYMHTSVETFDMHALTECARLLTAYCAAIDDSWRDELWN